MSLIDDFEVWFDKQNFRNFSAHEFTDYFQVTRRGVTNSCPPRAFWPRIIPTLRIVDDLRDFYGKPITLHSSYRSARYNAAIGDAAPRSQHKQFTALDFSVKAVPPSKVFKQLKEWRDHKRFLGGLGLYNTFTHIDTRGYNATW